MRDLFEQPKPLHRYVVTESGGSCAHIEKGTILVDTWRGRRTTWSVVDRSFNPSGFIEGVHVERVSDVEKAAERERRRAALAAAEEASDA